ncbi:carbamoyltransferase family protein [Glaciecola petra]|uniref:Carbamoyltransferase n=1 Tax=Glaciecola petra TaxID=3075602 RepID=A0ABU2ZPW8_9ALTE|nr:carbamoyltransferase [Aestuariibacter sp. P117]MDT0594456.1 carbamoyltransferase [Aestuariibacter sp. P117]
MSEELNGSKRQQDQSNIGELSKTLPQKNCVILGISAYYHDSAAAILVNGEIIAASQQERYSRKKHDPAFPIDAIDFCLERAGVDLENVDAVVFYDKPLLKFERLLETYMANAPKGYRSFVRAMPIWLKEKLYLKKVLKDELSNIVFRRYANQTDLSLSEAKSKLKKKVKLPQLLFCEHHQSHAAAAFYPSPHVSAAVVCLDGVGEWTTSSIWQGKDKQIIPLQEIQFPHSLGLLYSAFTQYCGFKVNSGEYKLMGLAPYGDAKYVQIIYDHLIDVREDGSFTLNMDYFDFATGSHMTNAAFHSLFDGPAHSFDAAMTQKQMDLAKSIQVVTEDIVLKIVATAYQLTGEENLCLAGGVALNCVSNARIIKESKFKHVWIQPAAGDAGSALGAALQVWHQYFEGKRTASNGRDDMQGAYLGDEFSKEQIESDITSLNLPFSVLSEDDLYTQTALYLSQEKVLGWFQGRMEFGPRALGNRSILGDPRSQKMQSQMNLKIKQRESFRPFAPAVLEDDAKQWFDLNCTSPYMLQTASVLKCKRVDECDAETKNESSVKGLAKLAQIRSQVPAITHVDYSARVQTVNESSNPKFHKLLNAFKVISGVGMVINTSFNVRGEPPVRCPKDAIRCFLATDMDVLVLDNFVLDKKEQPLDAIRNAKLIHFEKD